MERRRYRHFPGGLGLPVIGHFWEFYNDLETALLTRYEKYGKVFVLTPIHHSVFLIGADANKFVLKDQQKHFSAGLAWGPHIGVLFKGGLLTQDGAEHQKHRRLMQPAFSDVALAGYLKSAETLIENTLSSWHHERDMFTHCKNLTLSIACKVLFGLHNENLYPKYYQLFSDLLAGAATINKLPGIGRTYSKALKARKELLKLLTPIVEERRQIHTDDMFGRLCRARYENGEMFTDEEIVNQMIFIMMAAHDTTASTLTSIIYELARAGEWQEILYTESLTVKRDKIPVNELPNTLKKHELVIKETLRLRMPLKVCIRVATKDLEFAGYKIEKGTMVTVCPNITHYLDEYWDQPRVFNPSRFEDESYIIPYSYMPFGGGLHICLGQMFAKKFLTVILNKLVLKKIWSTPEPIEFQQVPVNVPKKPLEIEFKDRVLH